MRVARVFLAALLVVVAGLVAAPPQSQAATMARIIVIDENGNLQLKEGRSAVPGRTSSQGPA